MRYNKRYNSRQKRCLERLNTTPTDQLALDAKIRLMQTSPTTAKGELSSGLSHLNSFFKRSALDRVKSIR